MGRYLAIDSFNTGTIGAGGSSAFNRTIGYSYFNIVKIKVVPSGSSTGWKLQVFKDAARTQELFATKDQVVGSFFAPTRRNGAEAKEGFVVPYEDLDAGGRLHLYVTNSDSVSRNYDIEITMEAIALVGAGTNTIEGAGPRLILNDLDEGSNEKIWDIAGVGGSLLLRTRTDADGAGNTVVSIARSATAIVGTSIFGPLNQSLTDTGVSIINNVIVSFHSSNATGSRSSLPSIFGSVYHDGAGAAVTLAGNYGYAEQSNGDVDRLEGIAGRVNITNANPSTTGNASPIVGVATISGGAATIIAVLRSEGAHVSGGSHGDMYGSLLDSNSKSGGTLSGANYGLRVLDQNIAGVPNYAIRTGVGMVKFGDSVFIGTNPAQSGTLGLPNAGNISVRNAANSADIVILGVDNTDTTVFRAVSGKSILFNDTSEDVDFVVNADAAEAFRVDAGLKSGIGSVILNTTIRKKGYTVATLPTGTEGDAAYVTDALAPAFGSTVVGSGAVKVPVFYNGTNWTVG